MKFANHFERIAPIAKLDDSNFTMNGLEKYGYYRFKLFVYGKLQNI